jgi:hypothetical protein
VDGWSSHGRLLAPLNQRMNIGVLTERGQSVARGKLPAPVCLAQRYRASCLAERAENGGKKLTRKWATQTPSGGRSQGRERIQGRQAEAPDGCPGSLQ